MRGGVELGERGRVPFAVVGVLLLVTSVLFAAATGPGRRTTEPAVDVVVERTTADARAALRDAVAAASVDAAAAPVVSTASTRWGAVIDGNRSFRDALRVRIYLAARERFASIDRTTRGLEGSASLAPTPTPAALRRAKRRVHVRRVAEPGAERRDEWGSHLRATVESISVRARDGNRTVGRRNVTLSVTVPTPVLAVHDRVARFQEQLNAGLADGGLASQLTARLYAVAYARGYAQYYGAPVANVVTNRHIELLANGALLDQQRQVFGASDPDGRRAMRTATARVAFSDLTAPLGDYAPTLPSLLNERLRAATRPSEGDSIPRVARPGRGLPNESVARPNQTVDVSVGVSADRAFVRLVTPSEDRETPGTGERVNPPRETGVNETIQSVYSASVGVAAATTNVSGAVPERPSVPDGARVVERARLSTTVQSVSPAGAGPTVDPRGGYHTLVTYDRIVTLEHTWRLVVAENGTNRTVTLNGTQRRRVRVALVGRHAATPFAPDEPIDPVHEPGGRLDTRNLANLTATARAEVVNASGGPDALAGRAARGTIEPPPWSGHRTATTVEVEWPDRVWEWIRRDLIEFREEIRNVTESVPRGALGTYQVSPAMDLRERLQRNRSQYLAVSEPYDGLAAKARVAVRGRLLNRTMHRLEVRAIRRNSTRGDLRDRLNQDSSPASLGRLQDSYDAYRSASGSDGRDLFSARRPDLDLRVDGAPPYLTTREIGHEQVPSIEPNETVYPMVAQNVNLVTIPYGSVVQSVLSELLGGGSDRHTDLETAGRALRAMNRTAASLENRSVTANESVDANRSVAANHSFAENRSALREQIYRQIYVSADGPSVDGSLTLILEEYGVNDSAQVVGDVLKNWSTLHARAIAIGNGSFIDPLVAAAARSDDGRLDSPVARDELRMALRRFHSETLQEESHQVNAEVVEQVSGHLQAAIGGQLEERLQRSLPDRDLRRINRRNAAQLSRLPTGIPIAPVPGLWYVTAGVWTVEVSGEYHRFAVEAPRPTADADDPSLSYVRDGDPVTLDVNGDSQPERLGTADRVSFDVETAVIVVVPPYNAGVGDTDGVMVENSPGWPYAGPQSDRPESCLDRLRDADPGTLVGQGRRVRILESANPEYACRNAMEEDESADGRDRLTGDGGRSDA